MKWELRTLSLKRSSWVLPLSAEYVKKIRHFQDFDFKTVKSPDDLIKSVDASDFLLVCDERGQSFSSEQFARRIEQIEALGKRKAVIVLGGPFGISEEVRERADLMLSLSSFVFNQEIALAVMLEQFFRAQTIIQNHPYHNA